MFKNDQIELLKQFVQVCKQNPLILHSPDLKFFKEWLDSLNASIPPKPEGCCGSSGTCKPPQEDTNKAQEKPSAEPEVEEMDDEEEPTRKPEASKVEEEEIESEESDVELDDIGGVVKDEEIIELAMGDEDREPSEEDEDAADGKISEANKAFSDGNYDEALKLYTEAVTLSANAASASYYAKRARVLLKLKKPTPAIVDCNRALKINENNPMGYKFRGMAYKMLEKYCEAYDDLQRAQKIDFDDDTAETLKEIEGNAHKLKRHKNKWDRKREERIIKEKIKLRDQRKREAEEEYEREQAREAAGGGFPGGFPGGMGGMGGMPGGMGGMPGGMPGMGGMPGGMGGGMPGGMGGMPGDMGGGMPGGMGGGAGGGPDISELFKDPAMMAAMQDPEVMAAFQDVSQNPANMSKYENNPKVKNIIEKLSAKFGKGGPQ